MKTLEDAFKKYQMDVRLNPKAALVDLNEAQLETLFNTIIKDPKLSGQFFLLPLPVFVSLNKTLFTQPIVATKQTKTENKIEELKVVLVQDETSKKEKKAPKKRAKKETATKVKDSVLFDTVEKPEETGSKN